MTNQFATIEDLPIDPMQKLSADARCRIIKIIEDEFNVQATMYQADSKNMQENIIREEKAKSGWLKMRRMVEKAEMNYSRLRKELRNTGFDEEGNLINYSGGNNDSGFERAQEIRRKLDNELKSIKPAHNIKSKIIARMALASTVGEAIVILRETLGNGIIPSLKLTEIKALPEMK